MALCSWYQALRLAKWEDILGIGAFFLVDPPRFLGINGIVVGKGAASLINVPLFLIRIAYFLLTGLFVV